MDAFPPYFITLPDGLGINPCDPPWNLPREGPEGSTQTRGQTSPRSFAPANRTDAVESCAAHLIDRLHDPHFLPENMATM